MSNFITINFIPCTPAPVNGYKVTWRVAGSGGPYTDEGFFTSSPAQFTDTLNPSGTCYEGFLQADCTGSGESNNVGNAIPWSTPCQESGVVTNYDITLTQPCSGNYSATYLVSGGTIGDTITVRAQFQGMIQKQALNFTRADLAIFSQHGTNDSASSACYTDVAPHPFSITADTVITMVATTETVTVNAIANNSSTSTNSVTVTIIDVNGQPTNIFENGCRGSSSTGGNC